VTLAKLFPHDAALCKREVEVNFNINNNDTQVSEFFSFIHILKPNQNYDEEYDETFALIFCSSHCVFFLFLPTRSRLLEPFDEEDDDEDDDDEFSAMSLSLYTCQSTYRKRSVVASVG